VDERRFSNEHGRAMLYDDEIVGIITLSRKEVQPFTYKQISLFEDFAAEAAIA
jgi:hypothetical protein